MAALPDNDRLLKTKQVAEIFGVTQYTVRNWVKEGKLADIRINGQIRIRTSEVQRFAQANYGDENESG